MSKLSSVLTPETDRAHYVAQGTLCVLAGIVVLALAWTGWHGGFSRRGGALEPASVATITPPPSFPATSTTPIYYNPAPIFPTQPILTTTTPAPLPTAPSSSLPSAGRPIENPQVKEMVEAARAVRKLGDMQAAIESLRAADLREPDHPEILSEIALTYEAMGLADKSQAAWKNVLAMSESVAGGFHALAKSKLAGREDAPPAAASLKPVLIGSCQVLPDTTVKKGQRLILRVPIIAAPGADVDPAQMDIHVYFYDKVGKDRVEPSKADPPDQKWVSERVDWALHNEELLDIVYHMPELRPEELRDLGKRSYYGYVVKLFYQNRLMSERADPPSLLDYKPPGPGSAGVENALFPKN